jgi:putative membrane protein
MLLKKNVNINQVIEGTWENFLFILITCILTYFLNKFVFHDLFEVPGLLPTILGTALSFFIGFNNNQAYDRWWEARKIWGALVNDSRSWARQVFHYVSKSEELNDDKVQSAKKRMIHNHIAFLYALKENLRNEQDQTYLGYLDSNDVEKIKSESNKANAILGLNNGVLNNIHKLNGIDGFQFLALNEMMVNFSNEMGKSERIKNTVFPTTYSYYTRMFIWVFIFSATLSMSQTIGPWAILIGLLIGYVFLTTYKIGASLVNPFENIPTGVSITQITRTIEINMLETLKEAEIPKPAESVDGIYIM